MLVDSGDGSRVSNERLRAFLAAHGVAQPAWLALTHFHVDHAGGAHGLGVPVALHELEAAQLAVNPRACDDWLGFEMEPYTVTRALRDGDVLEGLHVIHTPGQTPGHVAYWLPDERVAITGDLVQADDVAWVPMRADALDTMIASVRRIAALDPVRVIPGHGPVVEDVPAAVELNLERYERFRQEPSRAVWHAVRRALIAHLMTRPRSAAALAALPWAAIAGAQVGLSARELVDRTLAGFVERGLVERDGDTFTVTLPHES